MHIQQMTEIFHDDLGYTNVILLLMDGAKGSLQKTSPKRHDGPKNNT